MNELRVSDSDRDRVAERLRVAAGEGRLGADELEDRLERAFAARTEAELGPLTADLPSPAQRPPRRRALTGMGYFWPIWPILGWGISFVGPGSLRGACRRRSSNQGSSTGTWPSSVAVGRGSGEPLR